MVEQDAQPSRPLDHDQSPEVREAELLRARMASLADQLESLAGQVRRAAALEQARRDGAPDDASR